VTVSLPFNTMRSLDQVYNALLLEIYVIWLWPICRKFN